MDHETLCGERESQPASLQKTHVFTRVGRGVTGSAVATPTSLARRCDHIIGLIDDLLGGPAACANTAVARNVRGSPRIERGMGERGARSDDVAA
jgi:hypothetical protein